MKINQTYIGLQVVTNDAPDATVYEIIELRRDGTQVMATLSELNHPEQAEFVSEVCYLQLPTIDQLTA
jgi:hypothetical protein